MVWGRERTRVSIEEGNPARIIQTKHSEHHFIFATIKKVPFPLHNRQFVNRVIGFWDGEDFVVVLHPAQVLVDYGVRSSLVTGGKHVGNQGFSCEPLRVQRDASSGSRRRRSQTKAYL